MPHRLFEGLSFCFFLSSFLVFVVIILISTIILPPKGLIQGPEEFAQGLALGVKSLVGGTVGKKCLDVDLVRRFFLKILGKCHHILSISRKAEYHNTVLNY